MPRERRIEYAGAIYHAMARGDRREDIVAGDQDMNPLQPGALGRNEGRAGTGAKRMRSRYLRHPAVDK